MESGKETVNKYIYDTSMEFSSYIVWNILLSLVVAPVLAALYVFNDDDPPTRPLGEFPLL